MSHVTVTMSEWKFVLSSKKVPVGTVVFKVVNKGKIGHNFRINGKTTAILAPGKSATLTVVFKKKASYAFVCSVTGHARLGMKGNLGVGVAPAPVPPTGSTTTTTTPGGGGGGTTVKCASPVATTVTVGEFEYGFTLSTTTVPCGSVTFNMTNTGGLVHNFDVQGVTGANGALINPAQSASMTVNLVPGKFTYVCDVTGHTEQGMNGLLTVTG